MDLQLELKTLVRRIRPGLIGAIRNPNRNLKQILEEFKRKPKYLEQMRSAFEVKVLTQDFVVAMTEAGISQHTGVFQEILRRLEYKILPKAQEDNDVLVLINDLFSGSGDADWLEELDDRLLHELLAQILPRAEKLNERLVPQLFYAMEILGLRLASIGLDPMVKSRLRERSDLQHAFVEVPRDVQKILESRDKSDGLLRQLQLCDQAVGFIRSRREQEGISMALTFRLQRIQELTKRMRLLIKITDAAIEGVDSSAAIALFRQIVLAQIEHFNLRQYLRRNLGLLAFQITEHTSRTGEHYVTSSRQEWVQMFYSSVKGGAIVALLAILKTLVSYVHLAPFFAALTYGLIYAVGFIVILQVGGVLATKQPAMTAAYLAAALDGAKNSLGALENLVEVIVRTIRSQLIALLANFLVAFPVAALICFALQKAGLPLMNEEKAVAAIESLHPLHSLTFLYAAIAGLCLFASGLLAGFASNWFHFNKVGKRLKTSPLFGWFLRGGNFDAAIRSVEHNIGSWVGNISLGFFLGTMPALGVIFGLPIDVRHVTFISATFGAAVSSLGFIVEWQMMVWLVCGILAVGLINLGVSFSLSLLVATSSRGVKFSQRRELLRLLSRRFFSRPWDFFLPPHKGSP